MTSFLSIFNSPNNVSKSQVFSKTQGNLWTPINQRIGYVLPIYIVTVKIPISQRNGKMARKYHSKAKPALWLPSIWKSRWHQCGSLAIPTPLLPAAYVNTFLDQFYLTPMNWGKTAGMFLLTIWSLLNNQTPIVPAHIAAQLSEQHRSKSIYYKIND